MCIRDRPVYGPSLLQLAGADREVTNTAMMGRGMVARIGAAGTSAIGAVKSGLSKVGGAISGAVGGLASMIMPLLVASIAASFLQGPMGEWVSNNTNFKRAGEKMKTDLIGGVVDLFTKSMQGADAARGHAETMTIGKAHFSTVGLARLGITSATFDKLEAPFGTIDYAQGTKAVVDKLSATNTDQKPGEKIDDWWKRVRSGLDASIVAGAQKYLYATPLDALLADKTLTSINAADLPIKDSAGLQTYLKGVFASQVGQLQADTRDAYSAAMTAPLMNRGFTVGQVSRLTTDQLSVLANIAQTDAAGTLGWLQDSLVKGYTGAVKPTTPKATGDSRSAIIGSSGGAPVDAKWLASIDQQAGLVTAQKNRTAAI